MAPPRARVARVIARGFVSLWKKGGWRCKGLEEEEVVK
jgi:hypothetical protein